MEYWKSKNIIKRLINEEAKRRYPNNFALQTAFKAGGYFVGCYEFEEQVENALKAEEEEKFKQKYSQYTKQELLDKIKVMQHEMEMSDRETMWNVCEDYIEEYQKAIEKGYYKDA